jgi:hypothetical protein
MRLRLFPVVLATATVICSSTGCSGRGHPDMEISAKSVKPDITQLTGAMLLDSTAMQAAVGGSSSIKASAGDAKVEVGSADREWSSLHRFTPAPCSKLKFDTLGGQATGREWGDKSWAAAEVALMILPERLDLAALVAQCGQVTDNYPGGSDTTSLAPATLPGLPAWATAYKMAGDNREVLRATGYYRGVLIMVSGTIRPSSAADPAAAAVFAKLFNAQVGQLENI